MKDVKAQINFFKRSAKRNLQVAETLCKAKHYDACLFFCHLALEKMLKGLVAIRTKQTPPYIHHLERLARLAGLEITKDQTETLRIINDFNIAGRYENAKLAFYKQCTASYTRKYFQITKKLMLWLEKRYIQK